MPDYTILLIDYEPRSIERTRRPLIEAGWSVVVAKDGLAGIKTFHDLAPSLVLVEAMIPKKHGFEVCQEIKKSAQGKRTPVVILTAVYRGRKYRSQAVHLYGCDEYLEKPIGDEQLVAAIRRLLPAPAQPETGPAERESLDSATEQEILARLDALLPGDDAPKSASG